MKLPNVSTEQVLEAIRRGVQDAFEACIRNATDCPTADILHTIGEGVKAAFVEIGCDCPALSGPTTTPKEPARV